MRALQARGTGIETRILHLLTVRSLALVAQMVERKTLNLVVVGSIPTGGAFWRVIEPRDAARVRPLRVETIGKPL